jgi:hypothetical protein
MNMRQTLKHTYHRHRCQNWKRAIVGVDDKKCVKGSESAELVGWTLAHGETQLGGNVQLPESELGIFATKPSSYRVGESHKRSHVTSKSPQGNEDIRT